MTVSTVVAGLLPIMWSTRVGSEVMKPLATPVLGGMVSSLLHVLVVTPVIFFWVHERRLGLQHEPLQTSASQSSISWKPIAAVLVLVVATVAAISLWRANGGARSVTERPSGQIVQHVYAGCVQISQLSPNGTLHQGRNVFTIEFRSADGRLVDAGAVRASGNMPMPAIVMSGGLTVHRTDDARRY